MRCRIGIGVLAMTALLLSAIRAQAQEDAPANVRTITTSGTATVYVVPNEAVIRFEVHNFDPDLTKARAANDAACAEVLKLVKSMGVQDKDVQIDRLRTEAVYEQEQGSPRKLTGYTTGRAYAVTLRELSKFQALSDAILTRTDCTFGGFEFRSSEMRKHRDEARKLAAHAAREKAQLLAAELNASVGRPRKVEETSEYFGGGQYFQNVQRSETADPDVRAEDAQHAPLGQIALSATVTATFDLNPQ